MSNVMAALPAEAWACKHCFPFPTLRSVLNSLFDDAHMKLHLHQGDCVQLATGDQMYQVIGVDDRQDRCWVRAWPLDHNGSPVFEISLQQVRSDRHPLPRRSLQPS